MYWEIVRLLKTLFYLAHTSLILVDYGGRALGLRFFMTWHNLMLIAAWPAEGYDLDLNSQGEL